MKNVGNQLDYHDYKKGSYFKILIVVQLCLFKLNTKTWFKYFYRFVCFFLVKTVLLLFARSRITLRGQHIIWIHWSVSPSGLNIAHRIRNKSLDVIHALWRWTAGVLHDSSPSWFERVKYARSQWGGNGKRWSNGKWSTWVIKTSRNQMRYPIIGNILLWKEKVL